MNNVVSPAKMEVSMWHCHKNWDFANIEWGYEDIRICLGVHKVNNCRIEGIYYQRHDINDGLKADSYKGNWLLFTDPNLVGFPMSFPFNEFWDHTNVQKR